MLPALQLQGSSLSMAVQCQLNLLQVHPWKEMMTKDKSRSPDSGITEDIEMVDIITKRKIFRRREMNQLS